MANLIDRARWAWYWYVQFYKAVIFFVVAWWLWPVLLVVVFLPFILLRVWWTGSVSEPVHAATLSDPRLEALGEAQSVISSAQAEAHDVWSRIEALRMRGEESARGETTSSAMEWRKHRDFDPEPVVAAGMERMAALDTAWRKVSSNRSDIIAQAELNREFERTHAWAAAISTQLHEIRTSVLRAEQAADDQAIYSSVP